MVRVIFEEEVSMKNGDILSVAVGTDGNGEVTLNGEPISFRVEVTEDD